MKKINTEFGEIEVTQNDLIHFEQGLLGFDDVKEYVLINHDEQGLIMTMQSAEGEIPQFVVIDPYAVYQQYNPIIGKNSLEMFETKQPNKLKYLVIAVVCENYLDTVVNLKSPIVIDPVTKKAAQIILENTDYPMRYKVFGDKEETKC